MSETMPKILQSIRAGCDEVAKIVERLKRELQTARQMLAADSELLKKLPKPGSVVFEPTGQNAGTLPNDYWQQSGSGSFLRWSPKCDPDNQPGYRRIEVPVPATSRLLDDIEADEAWAEFARNHILPDRVFKLAMGMEHPITEDEAKHLNECSSCSRAYQAYRRDRAAEGGASERKETR